MFEPDRNLFLSLSSWDIKSTFLMYSLLDGLFHLPNIRDISLNFLIPGSSQRPGIFPLCRFSHLHSIKLASISNPPFYFDILQQLTKSVGRHPDLIHLDIGLSNDNTIFSNLECVLHYIINNTTGVTKTVPLKLQSLRVHGVTLQIDSFTLPHLRYLSALDISWLPARDNSRLWSSLQTASIRLTKISVDRICVGLLDYLASYPGLQHFSLVPPEKRVASVTMSDHSLQTRFFDRVLVGHAEHLRTLHLGRKSHPREWRLTLANMVSLSTCKNVYEMGISIPFDDLGREDFLVSEDLGSLTCF